MELINLVGPAFLEASCQKVETKMKKKDTVEVDNTNAPRYLGPEPQLNGVPYSQLSVLGQGVLLEMGKIKVARVNSKNLTDARLTLCRAGIGFDKESLSDAISKCHTVVRDAQWSAFQYCAGRSDKNEILDILATKGLFHF